MATPSTESTVQHEASAVPTTGRAGFSISSDRAECKEVTRDLASRQSHLSIHRLSWDCTNRRDHECVQISFYRLAKGLQNYSDTSATTFRKPVGRTSADHSAMQDVPSMRSCLRSAKSSSPMLILTSRGSSSTSETILCSMSDSTPPRDVAFCTLSVQPCRGRGERTNGENLQLARESSRSFW